MPRYYQITNPSSDLGVFEANSEQEARALAGDSDDLQVREVRPIGHPPLSPDEPSERLTLRLPASQAAALRADPRGASEAIRDALELVNQIAGSGQHSHPVPTAELSSVLMRDGQHRGTLLTLLPDGRYLVSSLDRRSAQVYDRLLLVAGGDWEQGEQPIACDSDSPKGLAFYADDYEGEGEILWDSAAAR